MAYKPVIVSYEDLFSKKDLSAPIQEAFGENGLGLILIKNYPELQNKRLNILKIIHKFANLPESTKLKYEHPKSSYSYGWSHGKEKLTDGRTDNAKGSYYANPVFDKLTTDENLKNQFPCDYSDNIWPTEEVPEMEAATKDMGKMQVEITTRLCQQFDQYLSKVTGGQHELGYFEENMIKSFKSRLLHYFPVKNINSVKKPAPSGDVDSSHCGWHLDHSSLTVLLSPLYLDLNGNTIAPPGDAGLYVKVRDGTNVKVSVPEDCLAVQLGEAMQVLSGGFLRATPHCVKASMDVNVSREQLAMFTACDLSFPMDLPEYALSWKKVVECPNLPRGVPPLEGRLTGSKDFCEFADRTYKAYYD